MNTKLSQIASATLPYNPATDTVIGVQGGTTDVQYPLSIVQTVLTGNLNLYVNASTGSDSYNGLSATFTGGVNGPKATIQAGANAAMAVDLNAFEPSIFVADGTYNESLFLGALTGLATETEAQIVNTLAYASIIGNSGSPGNVVLNYPDTGAGGINVFGPGAIWFMDGFTRQCAGNSNFTYGLRVGFGGIFWEGSVNMESTGGGPQISVTNSSQYNGYPPFFPYNNTIAVSGSAEKLIECGRHVVVDFEPTTLVLSSPTFTGATITADQQSEVIFAPGSSSGTATGQQFQLDNQSQIVTFGVGIASIPGDSPGIADPSCGVDGAPVPITVATLNSNFPASSYQGARMFVTDSNAFAGIVKGGGSNKIPVYSDGTNWLVEVVGSPAWTPLDLPGIQLWLDAGQGVNESGGTVSSWTDQSANAYVFTATGSPSFNATGFNAAFPGISTVSNSFLRNSAFSLNSAFVSAFVVFSFASASAFGRVFSLFTSTNDFTNPSFCLNASSAGHFPGSWAGTQTSPNPLFGYDSLPQNLGFIGGYLVYWNGEPISGASVGGTTLGAGASNVLTLGADNNGSTNADVTLAEVIVCNGNVSPADVRQLSVYLTNKYGIPL